MKCLRSKKRLNASDYTTLSNFSKYFLLSQTACNRVVTLPDILLYLRENPRQGLIRRQSRRPLARTPSHSTPTLLRVDVLRHDDSPAVPCHIPSTQDHVCAEGEAEGGEDGRGLTPPIQCGLEDRSSLAGLSEGDNHSFLFL